MIELFTLLVFGMGVLTSLILLFWFIKLVFKVAFYLSAFIVGIIAFLVFFPIILALFIIGVKLFVFFIIIIPLMAGVLLLYLLASFLA